jgi:hypothetical protein
VATDDFTVNLMRVIAGTLYFSVSMQAGREMYGKSYFALGVQEKASVDQAVYAQVAAHFQAITPESLKQQTATQPAGFQVQSPKTTTTD